MADSEVAATALPPTADPQDPLPESSWFWRRVFVFAMTGLVLLALSVVLWMLYRLSNQVLDLVGRLSTTRDVRALDSALDAVAGVAHSLFRLGFWCIVLLIVNQVLYLIAPSAEQATKMLATVSAWKSGVSTSSMSRSLDTSGTLTEAHVAAGPAVPTLPEAPAPVEVDAAPTSRA